MLKDVVEKGVASILARWMLESRAESLYSAIERSGALRPDEIGKLREEIKVYLERVRDDGAPYADLIGQAIGDLRRLAPSFVDLARTAGSMAAHAVLKAVEERNAHLGSRDASAPQPVDASPSTETT